MLVRRREDRESKEEPAPNRLWVGGAEDRELWRWMKEAGQRRSQEKGLVVAWGDLLGLALGLSGEMY